MFIVFGELTPLSWGLLGFVFLFLLQLVLCFQVRRTWFKCLPICLVLLGALFAFSIYMGFGGLFSLGAISGNEVLGLFLAFIIGISAIGIFFAWLVYWFISWRRRKKEFESILW